MTLDAERAEDLLYHGFQARFLERRVRELAGAGELSREYAAFRIDCRAVVMARAMRSRADGRGDACAPGPVSPGPALAFGATPLEFLRCAGRKGTSPAAARGGGRSWTDLRRGLFGWSGARGTTTQVTAGAALAFRQRDEDRAALVFEDFAAVETGAWHEGMSLAAASGVPLIAALVTGPGADADRAPGVAEVAANYGAPTERIGSEPLEEVLRTLSGARRRVTAEGGPLVVEVAPQVGARWAGHDALIDWAAAGGVSAQRLDAVRKAARAGVDHAASRLRKEPEPHPRDALCPVTADAAPAPPWTRLQPPRPDVAARASGDGAEAVLWGAAGGSAERRPWPRRGAHAQAALWDAAPAR